MAKDVIITPASGKLDFYATTGGSVLANINLTDNNDLSLSTTSGNLIIGDASRDVYIGDGTNEVDIVFEQNGEIRSVAGKYITVNAGTVNATGVAVNTSSPTAVMHVYGSTPSGTVFNVEGTNGSLFSVVDNLSGTLMSVNNNAGLPVLEVFSDDKIVGGRFGQNDFVVSSSGNVGIGVANPSTKLEVSGTITATTLVKSGGTSSQFLKADGSVDSTAYTTNTGTVTGIGAGSGMNFTFITGTGSVTLGTPSNITLSSTNTLSANSHAHAFVPGGTTSQYIRGDGSLSTLSTDVGTILNNSITGAITTVATSNLTINRLLRSDGSGKIAVAGIGIDSNSNITSQIINTTAYNANTGAGQIYLNGATANRLEFNTNGVAAPSIISRTAGTKILLYPAYSVGSSVDYAIGIDSGTLWQSVNTTSSEFKWYAAATQLATLKGTGRLGIGTTSPNEALEVNGTIRISDTGGRLQLYRGGGSAYDYTIGLVGSHTAISTANDATTQRYVQFGHHVSTTFNPKTVINGYNGRVGIGYTAPSYPLHVLGNVSFGSASVSEAILFDSSIPSITMTNSNADTVAIISDTSTHFFGDFNADGLYFDKIDTRVGIKTQAPEEELHVNGGIRFAPATSVTLSNNGDVSFERVSNTQLRIKMRGTDGTTRSVTLTLA